MNDAQNARGPMITKRQSWGGMRWLTVSLGLQVHTYLVRPARDRPADHQRLVALRVVPQGPDQRYRRGGFGRLLAPALFGGAGGGRDLLRAGVLASSCIDAVDRTRHHPRLCAEPTTRGAAAGCKVAHTLSQHAGNNLCRRCHELGGNMQGQGGQCMQGQFDDFKTNA
jgi:hypothetical protein